MNNPNSLVISQEDNCSICTEPLLRPQAEPFQVLACSIPGAPHAFHNSCLRSNLEAGVARKCPLCKTGSIPNEMRERIGAPLQPLPRQVVVPPEMQLQEPLLRLPPPPFFFDEAPFQQNMDLNDPEFRRIPLVPSLSCSLPFYGALGGAISGYGIAHSLGAATLPAVGASIGGGVAGMGLGYAAYRAYRACF